MEHLYSPAYGKSVASPKGYTGLKNRLRLRVLAGLVAPCFGESILEVGCNDGALVQHMSRVVRDVWGVDVNESLRGKAGPGHFRVMSATNLGFADGLFDKVCSFEVLEHIVDVRQAFLEAHRVLKPAGLFVISFPVEIVRGQQALLDAIVVYGNPFVARKLHVHLLTPGKVRKIVDGIPFVVEKSSISFIPFPSFVMRLRKSG
jgi:SAM-dependent methyltransferase